MEKARRGGPSQLLRVSPGGGVNQQIPVACDTIIRLETVSATPPPTGPLAVPAAPILTPAQLEAQRVAAALSAPRIGTYLAATRGAPADVAAVALYAWNTQVSAALLHPLSVCEVVIRNAASEALERQYGANWPWHPGLIRNLPAPNPPAFNPRRELQRAVQAATGAAGVATTGRVIAELKFKFWETLFTGRFDRTLWNAHLLAVLPNLAGRGPIPTLRRQVHDDLEELRTLRNRIAHHEPIFARPLTTHLAKIMRLVSYRCMVTANWMSGQERVSSLIGTKPP